MNVFLKHRNHFGYTLIIAHEKENVKDFLSQFCKNYSYTLPRVMTFVVYKTKHMPGEKAPILIFS